MGHVIVERIIEAPVEAVWAALNDIERTPEWVTGLVAAEVVTPGAFGRGTTYVDHNRIGPFTQVTPWHIIAFEPMMRQVHVSESTVLPSTMSLIVAPTAVGTYVQMQVDYEFLPRLGWFARMFELLAMNQMLRQVLTQNLSNLNVYLAGKSVTPAPAMA